MRGGGTSSAMKETEEGSFRGSSSAASALGSAEEVRSFFEEKKEVTLSSRETLFRLSFFSPTDARDSRTDGSTA